MTWWARLWRRRKMEEQLERELRFHVDQHASDLIARGYDPAEARRQARLALGGPEQVKEMCRDSRGTRWLEDLPHDFRYAGRSLKHRPAFAAISVLTLALGIGAATAIFSAVNPILFESLPYPHPDRVITIWDFGNAGARLNVTFGTYRELVARNHSFDVLAVMKPWQPTLTEGAEPTRLEGQRVSATYCQVLGVHPALGRDFDPSDDQVNGSRVAVLSDGLWRRRFAGDSTIIGRQITLDGNLYSIIGVMPSAFENLLAPQAQLWTLLQYDKSLPSEGREWGHHLRMIGRLREGVGVDQARRELDTIAHAPAPEFSRPPHASLAQGLMVNSLQDDVTSDIKPALIAIVGAVLLLLLIASVNVTNLLLSRGAQRRGELAMRVALGATRTRLVRQMLAESLLMALVGGALGLLLAEFGVRALVAFSPFGLPRVSAIGLDGAVFIFTLGTTTLVGLLVGLIPALHATGNLNARLRQSSGRTAGGHQLTRRALVVTEVALALVLLVSAGLLLHSLERLFAIDPGFDASHVLVMQIVTSGRRFDDDAATHRFFDQSLESVRHVPGVAAAALTSQLPLSGDLEDGYGVHFAAGPTGNSEADNGALRYAVSPGYFEAMGIPLRLGRLLNEHDVANAPVAVLISESLAKTKFPGQSPIGERLRIGPSSGPWATIVGIVGDVRQTSLAVSQTDAVYITTAQWRLFVDRAQWLVVRARGDADLLTPAIRKAIWSVDKAQPIDRVASMKQMLSASASERHFALILFEAFGLTALALAAIGIYGLLSGSVTERTREIGVRLALGASRSNILALVMRQGLILTALGVALGLCGAAIASKAIITLLYGVSRLDPIAYLGVSGLLMGVATIACWVPAWRAARVDPTTALRSE